MHTRRCQGSRAAMLAKYGTVSALLLLLLTAPLAVDAEVRFVSVAGSSARRAPASLFTPEVRRIEPETDSTEEFFGVV